jgi:hypothetical protein
VAAAMAIKNGSAVPDVHVVELQETLKSEAAVFDYVRTPQQDALSIIHKKRMPGESPGSIGSIRPKFRSPSATKNVLLGSGRDLRRSQQQLTHQIRCRHGSAGGRMQMALRSTLICAAWAWSPLRFLIHAAVPHVIPID